MNHVQEKRMSKSAVRPEEQDTFTIILQAIDKTETDPDRHLSIQIDQSIRSAIRAAQASNRPATVIIKLKMQAGPERRMEFHGGVDCKLPKPSAPAVTLYADSEGGVHRSDPKQGQLFPSSTRSPQEN
jgi:hypothetical protein